MKRCWYSLSVALCLCWLSACGGGASSAANQSAEVAINLNVYNDLATIEAYLAQLAQRENASLELVGKSVNGRDILALKLSSELANARDVVVVAGQHAREWMSPASTLLAAEYFSSANPELSSIRANVNLWFVVVANPDGYAHTLSTQRLWRKNRRQNADASVGVDLNRNYPFMWAQHRSSENGTSQIYHGAAPLSEPESEAVANLIQRENTVAVLDIHAYAQCIHAVKDHPRAIEVGQKMTKAMTDASGDEYRFNTVNLPYYGGSLFEWASSVNDVDGFLIELLPNIQLRDRYAWLNEGRSPFDPPESEIANSWLALQAGLMSAFNDYAEL